MPVQPGQVEALDEAIALRPVHRRFAGGPANPRDLRLDEDWGGSAPKSGLAGFRHLGAFVVLMRDAKRSVRRFKARSAGENRRLPAMRSGPPQERPETESGDAPITLEAQILPRDLCQNLCRNKL